jgi:hypothetical protein
LLNPLPYVERIRFLRSTVNRTRIPR